MYYDSLTLLKAKFLYLGQRKFERNTLTEAILKVKIKVIF